MESRVYMSFSFAIYKKVMKLFIHPKTEITYQVGEDDLTIQLGINFTILKQDKVVALKNQFHHLEPRSS
jgi:hypothetical protein